VLGIVCPGSAVVAERPSRKTTPQRSLRSTTNPPPLAIDASPLRMRVETPEGVLVVYDAASPPGVGEGCSGYLAYWLSTPDITPYLFPAVLHQDGDLAPALHALERDLGVDLEALADTDDRVDQALSALAEAPNGEIVWEPATLRRAVEIMGFAPSDVDDLQDGNPTVACACQPCVAGVDPPPRCDSPHALVREALGVVADCCGCEGPPPPPPCTGPCCGNSDPCCGSSDPCCDPSDVCCGNPNPCCKPHNPDCGVCVVACCRSSDPCCNQPNACCGSNNPCCGDADPCCGSLDPCCGYLEVVEDPCCNDRCCQGNECCKSPDPCCRATDDCCGNPNRCCNPDNSCCGSPNPCCLPSSPCCGNPDRCCNTDNPCCGSHDPCCKPNDPCCGNPNPCCNPDNPDCGVCASACCGSTDPCCNNPDQCCGAAQEPQFVVEEVSFTGDWQMYADAPPFGNGGGWGAGTSLYAPDWKRDDNPDHPVCYTKYNRMNLTVKLRVTANRSGTATLKVSGLSGSITGTRDFGVTCGTNVVTVGPLQTSRLPNYVTLYEKLFLTWYVEPPPPSTSAFKWIGNTLHDVYVIYGTPNGSNAPTRTRLHYFCQWANGKANAVQVTEGVHLSLNNNPPKDGNGGWQSDNWELMSGYCDPISGNCYKGECHQQARFMDRALRLMGVLGGSDPTIIYLIHASTDSVIDPWEYEWRYAWQLGIIRDLNLNGQIGDERLDLVFDFNPPNGKINNFEGTLQAPGGYYAVWPNLSATSPCGLLREIKDVPGETYPYNKATQVWYYRANLQADIDRGAQPYIHSPPYPYPMCP
jgi:hypothetical protein